MCACVWVCVLVSSAEVTCHFKAHRTLARTGKLGGGVDLGRGGIDLGLKGGGGLRGRLKGACA